MRVFEVTVVEEGAEGVVEAGIEDAEEEDDEGVEWEVGGDVGVVADDAVIFFNLFFSPSSTFCTRAKDAAVPPLQFSIL